MNRPTVLILSSNPAFARAIAVDWPVNEDAPEFTVLDQRLFREIAAGNYDLAIADGTAAENRSDLKQALLDAGKSAILIGGDQALSSWPKRDRSQSGHMMIELNADLTSRTHGEKPAWPTIAGLLGREILRRSEAENRIRDAEALCDAVQADATLGRYIAEMRHKINNSLTSVLGNAELLTLEPGLSATVVSQSETILNMALRLHEVFRRFASLEEELSVAARLGRKGEGNARSAGQGR